MSNIKVLRLEDLDAILQYEQKRAADLYETSIEQELAAWHAPWRKEALEHYLPLGWSFAIWQGQEGESDLLAYFLAQPLLFVEAMTQSLWLEHIGYNSQDQALELIDVAYRLSREKHLQKLKVPKKIVGELDLTNWKFQESDNKILELLTAKVKN